MGLWQRRKQRRREREDDEYYTPSIDLKVALSGDEVLDIARVQEVVRASVQERCVWMRFEQVGPFQFSAGPVQTRITRDETSAQSDQSVIYSVWMSSALLGSRGLRTFERHYRRLMRDIAHHLPPSHVMWSTLKFVSVPIARTGTESGESA